MENQNKPFSLLCEAAEKNHKGFKVEENGEIISVSAKTAKQVNDFRNRLNPLSKGAMDQLLVSEQLQIAACEKFFSKVEEN